jgi:phosphoglycolate phosphatase
MRYRLAVFDFDGTIVDSAGAIVAAAQAALRAAGHAEPEAGMVRTLVGLPLDVVLNSLTGGDRPDAEIADLVANYRSQFTGLARGRTALFEGVREAIDKLARAGIILAVATSRNRSSLEHLLEVHGLRRRFSSLITDHCVARGKPHPEMLRGLMREFAVEPGETVMIGDTVFDMRMGHAAGTDTCAVTYGYHPADELQAEEPTYLVAHARDIPGVLA